MNFPIYSFVFGFCFAPPIFGLTNITIRNSYAIFQPDNNEIKFSLEKCMEILFLQQADKPIHEESPYSLRITYNETKHTTPKAYRTHFVLTLHIITFELYKEGSLKNQTKHELDEKLDMKNMRLRWGQTGCINVDIFNNYLKVYSNFFTWSDYESVPTSFSHLAIKSENASNIYQKDSYMWMSDVQKVCPEHNAYLICDLHINTFDIDLTNETTRSLRKVMYLKLQPKHSTEGNNYEIQIAVNQTDKTDSRFYVMKNNERKAKVNLIDAYMNLRINISDGSIIVGKKKDGPIFLWKDSEEPSKKTFYDIKYAFLQILEKTGSSMNTTKLSTSSKNACQVFCNPGKNPSWWKRLSSWWKHS